MKKNSSILIMAIVAFCFTAKAQQQTGSIKPGAYNAMQMLSYTIRINPADSLMLHEKALILSPIMLTPDPTAKIYTNEERDSILKMVEDFRKIIQKN